MTKQIGKYPDFGIDRRGLDCLNTMFMINVEDEAFDPLFVLGILNSGFIRAFWNDRFYDQRRTFPKIKGTYLKELPIPDKPTSFGGDKLSPLVSMMLELQARVDGQVTDHERTALERQIQVLDRKIDKLVYDLYDLTQEEVALVESSMEHRVPAQPSVTVA